MKKASHDIQNEKMNIKTVLIIEDEYLIATDIKEKAEEAGYKVIGIAKSSNEVESFLNNEIPDVVLLDISLGKENGTEIAQNILNPRFIPFIYITSYDDGPNFEKAKRTKPYGFLNKPVKKRELSNTIELALYRAENEQIRELLREKQILLKITEGVNKLRTVQDFFSFLVKELKPIFHFDDVGVFLFDEDKKAHYKLSSSDLKISNDNLNKESLVNKVGNILHKGSAVAFMMNEIGNTSEPLLFDFQELISKFPKYPLFKTGDGTFLNYRDCLATNLRVGDNNLGMFCMNKLDQNTFSKGQITLLSNISGPLSVGVANIMANERLMKEKVYKETLLEISECTSSIYEPKNLIDAILENIKPFFTFDGVGLYVNSKEDDKMMDWAINDIDSFKFKGSVIETISKQIQELGQPVIRNYGNRYLEESNKIEIVINTIKSNKYREFMATNLSSFGRNLGVLYFNSSDQNQFDPSQFRLFEAVAEKIATSVSNILNRREILRRDNEKAFQIEFGKEMAKAQDFKTLLEAMFNKLSERLHLSVLSLTVWKEDKLIISQVLEATGKKIQNISKDFNPHFEKIFRDFLKESQEENLDPKVLNGKTLEKASGKSCLLGAFVNKTKVDSVLQIKKKTQNNEYLLLQFGDKSTPYAIEDLYIVNEYLSLIELSITNHLSFLSIEELNFRINQEKEYLEAEISTGYNFGELIGSSTKMQEIYRQISLAAPTDATVLVTGETGTGKELVARAIHNYSKRKKHSIIKINCAALPATLIESELFGHEKGSFTGASQRRIGKFELADKGTIFLDEIGELPLEIQVKLLRVLQEKEFERVGGNLTIKSDVRVIAATNRDLMKEVAGKNFREDLYYRLDVFPIALPALREHKEDIPELAMHFIKKSGQRLGKKINSISDQALRELMGYDFPGNVRELEHSIEQALITSKGNYLKLNLDSRRKKRADMDSENIDGPVQLRTYEQGEIDLILNTLKFTGGKVRGLGGAAEILDIHPNTLESKMRRLGIKRKHVLEVIEDDNI